MERRFRAAALLAAAGWFAVPAAACSLCGGDLQKRLTLREQAARARLIVYGPVSNSRLEPDGGGSAELAAEAVLKGDDIAAGQRSFALPRYLPADGGAVRYLVFCDVQDGRLEPLAGSPVKSPALADYCRSLLSIDATGALAHAARHLDSADPDIAADAFLEFAKAPDSAVTQAARGLDAARLRSIIADPRTPSERVNVLAYLLGVCGSPADADFLIALAERPDERTRPALCGVLSGCVLLRPAEGWRLGQAVLADAGRPFSDKLSVLAAVRFLHSLRGDADREAAAACLAVAVAHGDLVDLAAEDLRKWGWWELTGPLLAQVGKPGYNSPLVRRSLLRYALTCPLPEARAFADAERRRDAALVADVEEGLSYERAAER